MTDLKQEAIILIESIPEERTDVLIKIIKNIRELVDFDQWRDEIFSRDEQDFALIEDAESLTHEELPDKKEALT